MTTDSRRITLIARRPTVSLRDWDFSNPLGSRLIFVDTVSFLTPVIYKGLELGQDIDRVIIDGTGTAAQYVELLASLPQEFLGDVLYIREEGDGFLSSVAYGGGRMMYSLRARDINFYLQTHGLLWAPFMEAPAQVRQFAMA
jgi:hypothetical protein